MYFMLATFVDILPWVMKQKKHWLSSRLRDFIFSVIAFPIATVSYCSITYYDIYVLAIDSPGRKQSYVINVY